MKNRKGSDKDTTNKEQILAKLRNALIEKTREFTRILTIYHMMQDTTLL